MFNHQLPFAFFQVVQTLFCMLSQYILLAITQPIIIRTLPLTVIAVVVVQRMYLRSSRQLRLLDLEARALVNTSFLERVEGIATICAFGWQRSDVKLVRSLRTDYMLACVQSWLNLILDLVVPGLAVCTIGLAIAFKRTTTGSQIKLALNVILLANQYPAPGGSEPVLAGYQGVDDANDGVAIAVMTSETACIDLTMRSLHCLKGNSSSSHLHERC